MITDKDYDIMEKYLGEGWSDKKAYNRETMEAFKGFEDWRQKILRYTNGSDEKSHKALLSLFKEVDKLVHQIEKIAQKSVVGK